MNKTTPVLMVYMTAANLAEAEKIAHVLVRKKAAACVNILGEIKSIYTWKGSIEHATEIAVVVKTTADSYPVVEKLIRDNHSYENPCIVAWPIDSGSKPYLDWVRGGREV